jgi:LPS export ABC transporter protein LptC
MLEIVSSALHERIKPSGKRTITAFLTSIYAVMLTTGCSDTGSGYESHPRNVQADTLISTTVSIEPEIEILQDGYVRTRATAPRGITRESQGVNETQLFGPPVHVEVLDSLGRVETLITCNEASYKSRDLRFEFFGDVKVKSGSEGDRNLKTERLVWNEELKEFTSGGFVIITTPADSITGYGFSGTQDLSEYQLRTVTGQFSVD